MSDVAFKKKSEFCSLDPNPKAECSPGRGSPVPLGDVCDLVFGKIGPHYLSKSLHIGDGLKTKHSVPGISAH